MPSISSRKVIRMLKNAGWIEVACVGDHHQFKHPYKPGRVTITHPKKDLPLGTIISIEKQSGIKILK